jgi:hypothetical protein
MLANSLGRHENGKKECPGSLFTEKQQALEMDGWSYCCYRGWSHGVSRRCDYGQSPQ